MRSRTTRCGQVRGVQPSRIGRCHDLPMFHVKQPPRRVSEGRRVVRPVGVPTNRGAAVFSREDSGGPSTGARGRPAVHGNGIETPWATEPRAAALWPIVEETRPAPLTGHPVVGESAWRRWVLGLCRKERPRRRPAHRPLAGCQSGHVTERLLCPTVPGPVRPRLRRERLRAESAADLRCLDDGRAPPAHEEFGVDRLLACRRGADQQPRRPGHLPREARRDHSLLRDGRLDPCATRNAVNGDGVGPSRGATTLRAYAMRALPAKRWAKPGPPSRERSTAYACAPLVCRFTWNIRPSLRAGATTVACAQRSKGVSEGRPS